MDTGHIVKKSFSIMKKDIIIILFVTLAIFIVYYQVGSHEFLSFDDNDYVSENQHVNTGLTIENITWALGFPDKQYWAPVSFISHMLDVELFGMNPGMHHYMNLFIHILNSLLLFIVLVMMTGARWRSAFVAGLFALHPVNVDSVAWLAERKNLLSTFFWMLSLLLYIRYTRKPDLRRYSSLIFVFTLGLLAKPAVVTLPFVLIMLDYWPLGRFRLSWIENNKRGKSTGVRLRVSGVPVARLIIEKLPMLVLSLAAIIISAGSVRHGGNDISTDMIPMVLRVENALVSYVLYIGKLIWPHNLTFFYPYPEAVPAWQAIGSTAVILLISIFALRCFITAPYVLFGWLWFLGTLLPMSGIMQGGLWPAIAERWAYIPFIGLFIVISWGGVDIARKLRVRREVLGAVSALILIVLAVLSWRQVEYWKDDETLYSYGIHINRDNFIAHVNLGYDYVKQNKPAEAIFHLNEALKKDKGHNVYFIAMVNLGMLYDKNKEGDKATYYYSQALKYKPNDIFIRKSLASIYADRGDMDKAFNEFAQMIRLDSRNAWAYYNLGVISARKGDREGAKKYFSSALKYKPDDAETHVALGVVLMNDGRRDEATAQFRDALRIDPKNQGARNYLNAAVSDGNKGVKVEPGNGRMGGALPNDPASMYKSAVSYSSRGEYDKALQILNILRANKPDDPGVDYNIACVYARQNKNEQAIGWLKKAIDKGFKDWKLMQSDPDLENIRKTDSFTTLMRVKGIPK